MERGIHGGGFLGPVGTAQIPLTPGRADQPGQFVPARHQAAAYFQVALEYPLQQFRFAGPLRGVERGVLRAAGELLHVPQIVRLFVHQGVPVQIDLLQGGSPAIVFFLWWRRAFGPFLLPFVFLFLVLNNLFLQTEYL